MLWGFHLFLLGFSVGVLGNLLTALVDRRLAIRMIPWVAFYSVFSAVLTVMLGAGFTMERVAVSDLKTKALLAAVSVSVIALYWALVPGFVARFDRWSQRELLGIEASWAQAPPFEGRNDADAEFSALARIVRIGLRSLDPGHTYRATAVIERITDGAEGGVLERSLRFMESGNGEADVPYDTKACVFLELLEIPQFEVTDARIPYAKKPKIGDKLKLRRPFDIRVRISGGPRLVYATVSIGTIDPITSIPFVVAFKAESPV